MIVSILFTLSVVLLFGLIIFIHEFGRFFTAKLSGIRVNEFAIGMGPALFYFQKGETQYSPRLLPISGYYVMEGEDGSSEDGRAFGNKPVQRRIVVVCTDAVMNILFGIVLMMVLLVQQPMSTSTTIAQFAEGSALQKAGIQTGGQLYSIDGYRVRTDRDPSFSLATVNPQSIDISVMRKGKRLTSYDVKMNACQNDDKQIMVLDFYASGIKRNPVTLIRRSGADTISAACMVWCNLAGLVAGQFGLNDIAGPIGTANTISQAASVGLKRGILPTVNNTIVMMMMITANPGVVSPLPLLALNGDRPVFLLIELVHRRPINPRYEGQIHAAGFALSMTFVVVVTYSDVLRLFTGKGLGT